MPPHKKMYTHTLVLPVKIHFLANCCHKFDNKTEECNTVIQANKSVSETHYSIILLKRTAKQRKAQIVQTRDVYMGWINPWVGQTFP